MQKQLSWNLADSKRDEDDENLVRTCVTQLTDHEHAVRRDMNLSISNDVLLTPALSAFLSEHSAWTYTEPHLVELTKNVTN